MQYKLLKSERETVINCNDAEDVAYISTSQEPMKRRLRKLAESHPDDVKITNEDHYTLFVELPKKWISPSRIRPPRQISEEQRLAASERLKKYRMEKFEGSNNENEEEDDI